MNRLIGMLALLLAFYAPGGAVAQDEEQTAPEGGSSQQVEESDEAFRRRMELEDARHRDPGFADPVDTWKRDLEKIDKLPEESRDNIRDQLIDIIMDDGEWEPADALKDYPYQPTAAAQADAELMKQEQEAWDEQIEKYHQRESEAFGAYRGPVQGPGNPAGAEGGQQGSEGQQDGQQGAQQGGAGQQADGEQGGDQSGAQGQQGGDQGSEGDAGSDSSAGTYEPYQPSSRSSSDETSTAGVSESALDFLMNRQNAQAADPQEPTPQPSEPQPSEPQPSEPQAESEPDTRGIIAIEDLDKLRGNAAPPPQDEEEEDP